MKKRTRKDIPFGNQRYTSNEINMAIRNFVFTNPEFYNHKYKKLSQPLKKARNKAKKEFDNKMERLREGATQTKRYTNCFKKAYAEMRKKHKILMSNEQKVSKSTKKNENEILTEEELLFRRQTVSMLMLFKK